MALNQQQLTEAMTDALKACKPPCGKLCTSGAEVTAEGHLRCWHNGIGDVKGNDQIITTADVLNKPQAWLSDRIKIWLEGQHRHEHVDLNALMRVDTSGPAMTGWPWKVQVTDCVRTANWPTGGTLP